MGSTKELIMRKVADTSDNQQKTSIFSNQHTMNNKELLGQVEGLTSEILKYYLREEISVCIGITAVKPNGAHIVVGVKGSSEHIGYACTVYAVSRRNRIIEHICDMFEKGAAPLVNEDWEILQQKAEETESYTRYF